MSSKFLCYRTNITPHKYVLSNLERGMNMIKRPALCLNVEDPEQKELYDFITLLPNGKARNTSSFLKTLVDREYQRKREEYLEQKGKFEQEKKTHSAPEDVVIKSENGGIKFTLN
jgi:hypothetical protein